MDRVYKVGLELKATGSAVTGLQKSSRAAETLSSKLRTTAAAAQSWGQSMVSSAMSTAAAYGAVAAKLGAGGLAAAAGLAAAKGFSFLTSMEASRNAIGGTLQLFNHSAGAADQLGRNIEVAEASLQRLIDIANKSPGELQDVQMLFQNMLPGARSITGDMERILKLTQQAANLTPVFGGDFQLTGAQLSRMMTGGAGAEMETWRTLQSVILDAGQAMNKAGSSSSKIFSKTQQLGSDLTMAFNKLAAEDRLRLIEAAFQRAGTGMSDLFAESWEGASSTFVSGWRQIAAAGATPMYETTKRALVRATKDGGVFDENAVKRMQNAAASVGMHFARMAEKGYARIESAISYLDKNWQKVANTAYHAFQVGAGLIKGAFAFGLSKMIVGSAVMAGGLAARGAMAVGRGASKVGGVALKAGGAAAKTFGMAAHLAGFGKLGTSLVAATSGALGLTAALLPMIAAGLAVGAVFGAMGLMVVGVAAYIASEWDSLMGSVKTGFEEGTLTVRPLVEAAMLLWERLKIVGVSLIGGATGADMFEGAMNMAVGAVDLVTQAVVGLAKVAAWMLEMAGKTRDFISDPVGLGAMEEKVLKSILANPDANLAQKEEARSRLEASRASKENQVDFQGMADKMRVAAMNMQKVSLKDLDFEKVDRYTKTLEDSLLGAIGEDGKRKRSRGAGVNIGTLNVNQDLRNEDPDRVMMSFVEPLQRLTQLPAASSAGAGGGRGF